MALDQLGTFTFGDLTIEIFDAVQDYVDWMKEIYDFNSIIKFFKANPSFTFLFDAMHAVTGPYAQRLFVDELGLSSSSVINGVPSETFNDGHPDPNLTYAHELVERVEKEGISFGAVVEIHSRLQMVTVIVT